MTRYQHQFLSGENCPWPAGKAVCVGRNYVEHARELNNPVPTTPLLFLKPTTSMVPLAPSFSLPADAGECHHELELSILIAAPLTRANSEEAAAAIAGIGLGLDLTLRDRQQALKTAGQPWEIAKAFDGALPLSPFISRAQWRESMPWQAARFSLTVNGECRQNGFAGDMITPVLPLIVYLTTIFSLQPGDVVMTGTPAGVAALRAGNSLELQLDGYARFQTRVDNNRVGEH